MRSVVAVRPETGFGARLGPSNGGAEVSHRASSDPPGDGTPANVFSVTATRDEVTFVFGRSHRSDEGARAVRLMNRIAMNPFAAKRLLLLLRGAIEQHESKFGPIEEAVSGSPAPLMSARPSEEGLESPEARRAERLIRPIRNLGVPYDFERSFKLSAGRVRKDRFLLIVDKDEIRGSPHERLASIARDLQMPADFLEIFEARLPDANPVDFGFEADGQACFYKAYLDFLPAWKHELATGAKSADPRLMFLGFKWDALGSGAKALTRYTWTPGISFDEIRTRVSALLEHDASGSASALFAGFLDLFESRTTAERVYYLDVTEDANPRRSFDLNGYSAGLRLADLAPLLIDACKHYAIPVREFRALFDQVQHRPFGHLSGGIDRRGQSFLTIYFGLQPVLGDHGAVGDATELE